MKLNIFNFISTMYVLSSNTVCLLQIIETDIESFHRQIEENLRLIQSSQCPHIVDYYQSFYNNGAISIMFEYMDGGSLADLLKKVKSIPEPYIAAICKQVGTFEL